MPYLAKTSQHSQFLRRAQQPEQDHPPRASFPTYNIDDTMMRLPATYARTSRIQTNTHPVDSTTPSSYTTPHQCVVPNPNADFLSKYQVPLPAVIADMTLGKADDPIHALPTSFKPTIYDVVCGRGKGSYNRPGNRRFRAIVQLHMDEYQAPTSRKLDKTMLLNHIMEQVQAQNEGTTRFLKRGKDGLFTVISDDLAREKVGHAIRETILAAENAAKPLKEQPEWKEKHSDLLAQQQAIFQNLVVQTHETPLRSFSPMTL
jgi:hypothetical protein